MGDALPDIAVLGAGAWGQALAVMLGRAGHRVALWARRPDHVLDPVTGQSRRLPGIALPPGVAIVADLPIAQRLVLVAVPVQHLRPVLARLGGAAPLVFCCKGLEAATGKLPTELAAELQPGRPALVLGGPNFAAEIARGQPAAAVLAGTDPALTDALADVLATPQFRIYPGADPLGCGLAGAAKNVVAIAAGIATGARLGENARAALVTRGLAEIARLLHAEGARPDTLAGLAGLGDLLLTCTGAASRNFRVGEALGRGERLAANEDVAEGVATGPALVRRASRTNVELPIAEAVMHILDGRLSVERAVDGLLARPRGRN